jgi:hypothetical protein
VTYDGKRAADIAVSRYAVRHLVASEASCFPIPAIHNFAHKCAQIDAQLINRQAEAVDRSKKTSRGFFGSAYVAYHTRRCAQADIRPAANLQNTTLTLSLARVRFSPQSPHRAPSSVCAGKTSWRRFDSVPYPP